MEVLLKDMDPTVFVTVLSIWLTNRLQAYAEKDWIESGVARGT